MIDLLVLCGGKSAEHDVSLRSAASVLRHLNRSRYRISVVGIQKDGTSYPSEELKKKLKEIPADALQFPFDSNWLCLLSRIDPAVDIVFPVLHGPYGEDGIVQGVFEALNLPYVGAGVYASAVGMNKLCCKTILIDAGLPILPYVSFDWLTWKKGQQECLERAEYRLSFPMFVKPVNMGSSVGVNKSKDRHGLQEHVQVAFRYDDVILIEQGIEAREIEISVLGNLEPRVSLAGEIRPSREFYSYEAKYEDAASELLIPAPLSDSQMREVQNLALKAYTALQLEGMARIDFLMDRKTDQIWLNEPNTIPGFTAISMYPKLWEASGLPYPQLLDELIQLGFEKHRRRNRLSVER
ncbi:MAG: D-alanine--D-alanine ligase family protein [Acidobacteriota bacterium]